MTKYRVSMHETVFYSVYVEASGETEAADLAEIKFQEGVYSYDGQDDRRIVDVEECE